MLSQRGGDALVVLTSLASGGDGHVRSSALKSLQKDKYNGRKGYTEEGEVVHR